MSAAISKTVLLLAAGLSAFVGACASRQGNTSTAPGGAVTAEGLDPADFRDDALKAPMTIEPCTLSGGTETTCYRIVAAGVPSDHKPGPFCPRTVSDTKETVGKWLDGSGVVYDADGAFIRGLDGLYGGVHGEGAWKLYDEATGAVRVTETKEACEAAARPDVSDEYNNYCVECSAGNYTDLEEITLLIPVKPVPSATVNEVRSAAKVGIALNGVELDPPAPVGAILAARTIAAFDDCGGHVNPHEGYHYHAAMGCSHQVAQADGHASKIGYALDGYAIYAERDNSGAETADLDACRGHSDKTRGYHYHVASPGENMFLGCFHGEVGTVVGAQAHPGGPPGGGPPGGGPPGGGPPGGPPGAPRK